MQIEHVSHNLVTSVTCNTNNLTQLDLTFVSLAILARQNGIHHFLDPNVTLFTGHTSSEQRRT